MVPFLQRGRSNLNTTLTCKGERHRKGAHLNRATLHTLFVATSTRHEDNITCPSLSTALWHHLLKGRGSDANQQPSYLSHPNPCSALIEARPFPKRSVHLCPQHPDPVPQRAVVQGQARVCKVRKGLRIRGGAGSYLRSARA